MFVSDIIDQVVEVLGRCDRTKAYQRITEAVAALQDEGDWNANVGMVDIPSCSNNRSVTLPRQVETPLAVAINNRPAFMRSEFFLYHLNGPGTNDKGVPWAWDDIGPVPVLLDNVEPSRLTAIADMGSDDAVVLRITGYDENRRVLREQLENGDWIDGMTVVARILSSYPGSIITEDTTRLFKRLFSPAAMNQLECAEDHNLANGSYMQLSVTAGSTPVPLVDGARYYVRISSDRIVTLHTTRLDARTGAAPIEVTELANGTTLNLQDKRLVTTRTQFLTSTPSLMADQDLVTFLGTVLPSPLSSDTPYYARLNGTDKFRIFANKEDAKNDENVINVTTPGTDVLARALKECHPYTYLNFPKNHNMLTGDAVTVENSGGSLPEPLVEGATYYVRSLSAKSMTLFSSASDAINNVNPITLSSLGSGTNSVVKSIAAAAVTGNSSNIRTAIAHNMNTPVGSGGTATATLVAQTVTAITVTNGGSGYEEAPFVNLLGGGYTTKASARAVVSGGVITSINVVAGGTGYTSVPVVQIVAAGGSFVRFSSNGTLPAPIEQGVVYRAESPMTATTFTLNSTVPETINITSQGSGQLYLLIGRSFSVGYQAPFTVDAANYTSGQPVRFFTQGALPTMSPAIDQTTVYYLRKLNSTSIEIYDTEAHATTLATTTGRFSTISIGTGALFLSSEKSVTAVPRDNTLELEFPGYLVSGAKLRFTTDGTLPAPLVADTDYLAVLTDGRLGLQTTLGADITLTDIGSGVHSMVLDREFSVISAKNLVIPSHQFTTGDALTVETSSELPVPLAVNTPYWARNVSAGAIELYDTENHALDLNSTDGRLEFLSTGAGEHKTIQEVAENLVSEITNVQKPTTNGFIKLYAWDSGREISPTLIADFHPTENEPRYRRIKVSEDCTTVSMKYKARTFAVSSERDFINLDSGFAIVLMVKSHELLLKNFTDEAEVFRKQAVERMNKRNRSLDGPRVDTLQINADIMNDPDDWMD